MRKTYLSPITEVTCHTMTIALLRASGSRVSTNLNFNYGGVSDFFTPQ